VSAGAERIRRFSIGTWIVGVIAISVIATVVMPQIMVDPDTGQVYVDDETPGDLEYPWLDDGVQELAIVDGQIQGTREGGYIRLEGGADMMMISAGEEDVDAADWVRVYQQLNTVMDVESDEWPTPGFLGSLYPDTEVVVLPGKEDGLLWFSPTVADWTATVTIADVIPMGESYSGEGNAVLLYDGDALSGRFQHSGTGLFSVSAVTVGDWQLLVNETDEVDMRTSWPPTDRVVFQVEADTGDGTWSITLDTPATDGSGTTEPTQPHPEQPDPAPTP
jgi:hypothetical protein